MTENTAACIECGAIATPGTRYCETCGAPVMSASVSPDPADPSNSSVRVFDSTGPTGATTAEVSAVVTGEVWVAESSPASVTAPVGGPPPPNVPPSPPASPPPASSPAGSPPAASSAAGGKASGPIIIGAPSASDAKPRGSGISAAIPSATSARLALDRAAGGDRARETASAEQARSYRERYADTQFAASPAATTPATAPAAGPPPAPAGPLTAAENEPPWHQIGCLRVITVILGLNWLVPGVIGLVADAILLRGGTPFGTVLPADFAARSQAAITLAGVVHLAWILIGVKLLVAPGRWSLAITGVASFLGAIGIVYLLSLFHDPAPGVIAGVGVLVVAEVVLGLMAITAAQSIE